MTRGREGGAAEELLKEANAAPTDLIAVGNRGRGGFGGLLLGSVAHHVIQHARCPVAVLPRLAGRTDAETPVAAATTA